MRLKGITVYKARIVENIFEGHVAEVALSQKMTVGQIRVFLKLDEQARFFQEGKELDEDQFPKEGCFTIKLIPGSFTTALAIIGIVVGIATIAIGIVNLSNLNNTKFPNLSNSQMSLRGSTNSARKTERLPLLLGKHRVYPDVAALPFSSYKDNNQYLHQLFCFGYSDVSIDYSTFKIGETLLSYYEDCTYNAGLGAIYPSRVVENVYQLELKNDGTATSIVRSTTSGCRQIEVGLMAPNGLYRYDGEDRKSLSVGVKIEWRVPSGSWITAFEETITENTDKWRKMYSITPSGSSEGTYEVRITRTTSESGDLQVSDALYLDVIKSFVGLDSTSSLPVTADSLQLVALKTKATDQLNGVIDSFNAVCTLNTRAWDGLGSGADHWTTKATRNPASAILYLLTNSNANAEPVEDSLIDWASFEDFYAFCEEYGFNCDAWITTDYTVLQLCEFVAASNMAEMVIQCDKISIRVEKAQEDIVQLFTPRNAWDFEMIRSFESKPRNITVSFNDETKGYVQVEREISLDDNGKIVFDSEQEGDSLTVDSFGVTSGLHAARLGAQKLKLLYSQTRTYSWKSDIEGIVCLPGDVVLLENDNFLLGLGEGRIKEILYSGEKISGIRLDARMKMVSGTSYGVRIRTSSSVLDSIPVVTEEGENWELTFQTSLASDIGFDVGDLVAFGELKVEARKVLITEMAPDQNRSCTFSAVDYSDDAYNQELTVPAYDSGLSDYPSDGGAVGATANNSVPRYVVYGTKGENGLSVKIQYCYSRSLTNPELQNQISWQDKPLFWGKGSLYWNAWQEDTLAEKDGYYIWVRMGLGENPEKWTYSRLTGAIGKTGDTGTPAKLCTLTCDHTTVTRNERRSDYQSVAFIVDVQGYNSAPSLFVNDAEVTLSQSATVSTQYSASMNVYYNSAESLEAIVYIDSVVLDKVSISVVDKTENGIYLGIQSALPTTYGSLALLAGDSCVYNNRVYIYNPSVQEGQEPWQIASESSLTDLQKSHALSSAMNDILSSITADTITSSDYAYFKTLITDTISADYISSKNIVVKEAIQSAEITKEKGFKLSSDGTITANNATLSNVQISGGEFSADSLKTQNTDENGFFYAITGTPSESGNASTEVKSEGGTTVGTLTKTQDNYYKTKDFAQWCLDNIPVDNTGFTQLEGTIDGYNAYAMRFSGSPSPSYSTLVSGLAKSSSTATKEATVDCGLYQRHVNLKIYRDGVFLGASVTTTIYDNGTQFAKFYVYNGGDNGAVSTLNGKNISWSTSDDSSYGYMYTFGVTLSSGVHTLKVVHAYTGLLENMFKLDISTTDMVTPYWPRLASRTGTGNEILLMLYQSDSSIVFNGGTASNPLKVISINSDISDTTTMTSLGSFTPNDTTYNTMAINLLYNGVACVCGGNQTSWTVTRYFKFLGLYNCGAGSWATPTIAGTISVKVKNAFINGTQQSQEFTLQWNGTALSLASDDKTISYQLDTNDYYTSLPSICMTAIVSSKGAYVSSLYPMKAGVGNIGSVSQPFNQVYANNYINMFPVGAIYMSVNPTSPASLFGGRWEALGENHTLWTTAWTDSTTTDLTTADDIPAGIPNVTGGFSADNVARDVNISSKGAFTWGFAWACFTSSANYNSTIGWKFDASKGEIHNGSYSNLVYGKSDTVQPPAYKIYAWKRLPDSTT